MNKIYLSIIAITILLSSCGDGKKQAIARSVIEARIDSIVGSRMEEVNRQSMEDLDHRMAIEVKAKADSIVQVRQAKMIRDTINHSMPVRDTSMKAMNGK